MTAPQRARISKDVRRRWQRAVMHAVPVAAAVVAIALVTTALEPTASSAISSSAQGVNAAWSPTLYRGTVDEALSSFLAPLARLLHVPNSPTSAWQQPGLRDQTTAFSSRIEPAGYRPAGASIEPAVSGTAWTGFGLGYVPYETFDTISLTTDTSAIVDQGNGNLILKSNDGSLNTFGANLSNDRYFNSAATYAGSQGGQWNSPLSGFDTGLYIGSTNVYYVGESGNVERFTPDGSGGWIQPPSFNATLTISGSSPKLVMNDTGETLAFNNSGWVTSDVDNNGIGKTFTYNGSGQVTKVTDTTGRFYSLSWSTTSPSYISAITDSASRVTTYTHDSSGRLTRVDSPGNYWETYGYNAAGLVSHIESVGPNGSTSVAIDLTYDSSDRLLSISQGTVGSSAYARTTSYGGWGASGTVSVTDGNGNITKRGVSANNVPISTTDPLGRKASWTHNANGDIITYTAPGATSSTSLTYNGNNSRIGTAAPTGGSTTTTYGTTAGCSGTGGTAYSPHCTTDTSGDTTAYTYDSSGNLLKAQDATSGGTGITLATNTYASAAGGCYTTASGSDTIIHGLAGEVCSSKTPNGNVTTYEYDTSGNVTAVDRPAPLVRTTSTYDSLGRVTSSTDGTGKTTTYAYNVRDQVVTTTYDSGTVLTTTYTPNAVESGSSTDSDNKDTYAYDVLGQLTSETTRHNAVHRSLTYTYDAAGNLLSYADMYGTVAYGYDAANELIRLTEPGGTCGTGTPAASSGCITFSYDARGAEVKRTFPGGAVVATTRDSSSRPTRITATDASGATVYDKAYSYGVSGLDTSDIQKATSYVETGVVAGALTTYGYDALDRLTSATETAGGATTAVWLYSYDSDGNRSKQVLSGAVGTASGAPTPGTTTYAYNSADELTSTSADTSTWAYDGDGQQTKSGLSGSASGYNDRHGTASSGSGSYVTFAEGNSPTYARTDGSTTTNFTNSSKLGLMGEDFGNQRIYDRAPNGDAIGSRLSAGSRYYFIEDVLGSIAGMFDKDGNYYGGYTYGPYGEARFTSSNTALSNNHLRYTGGYYDTSNGLYLFGSRYYDTSTGRFTQTDPATADVNPYAYVADSPISNIDPDGLKKKKSFWKTVASIATVVAGVLAAAEWFICPALATLCLIVKAALFFADALSTVITCASGSTADCMLGIVSTAIDVIGLPGGIALKFKKIAKKAITRMAEITEKIIAGEATMLSSYSALVSLADLFT